MTLNVQR